MVNRRVAVGLLLVLGTTAGCLTPVPSYCLSDADCDGGVCVEFACTAVKDGGSDGGNRRDAGFDAGPGDAGLDAGTADGGDAGVDAGFDAGLDAGVDAGLDAGFDAGCQPLLDPDGGIQPRAHFSIAAVGEVIWVAGGLDSCGNTLDDIEALATAAYPQLASSHTGLLGTARSGMSGAAMPDGDGGSVIFFVGGFEGHVLPTVTSCDTAFCLNDFNLPPWTPMTSNRSWTSTASVPVTVAESSSGYAGSETLLLVVGGDTYPYSRPCGTLDIFDPHGSPGGGSQGSWQRMPSVPTNRGFLGTAVGPDGNLYAIGGQDDAGEALAANEVFNASPACLQSEAALTGGALIFDGGAGGTCGWAIAPSLPTPRWDLAVVTGPDGLIYATGGALSDGRVTAEVDAYSTDSGSWSSVPPLNVARRGHGAVTTNAGLIWVVGGYAADGGVLSAVEVYDPSSDGGWTLASP
jgi:hypothetical protein